MKKIIIMLAGAALVCCGSTTFFQYKAVVSRQEATNIVESAGLTLHKACVFGTNGEYGLPQVSAAQMELILSEVGFTNRASAVDSVSIHSNGRVHVLYRP